MGALKHKRSMAVAEVSWTFATRGSRASWACESFMVHGLVKVQMEPLWACLTYNLQQ
jgi:hypothetical protein